MIFVLVVSSSDNGTADGDTNLSKSDGTERAALFDMDTGPHPLQWGAAGRGRRVLVRRRASPGVLGGRTRVNTHTCQPEEGNKGEM